MMTRVGEWMTKHPAILYPEQTIREVIQLFSQLQTDKAVVINEANEIIGIFTHRCLINGLDDRIKEIVNGPVPAVSEQTLIEEIEGIVDEPLQIVDNSGKWIGIFTPDDHWKAIASFAASLKARLHEAHYGLETLKAVLDAAYEGIVVIDAQGIIREFNKAYSRFLGIKRGEVQQILGQDMIVHRIPIWQDNKVVGAIGMLIFQGVTEVYHILNRVQDLSRSVAAEQCAVRKEPPARSKGKVGFDSIIGRSEQLSEVKRLARRAARIPSTVLITGESGTGKEMFARAIHEASLYAKGNFVSVNCAAIPEQLLETELFGYEEGAFTGARRGGKPGKFQLAHKGTLFLDEIGDMPLYMQAKILRVLEERAVERVGGTTESELDVRIITATNKNMEEMVRKKEFREDLFFRLNIIRLHLPSLHERKEDIPYLLASQMEKVCRDFGIEKKEFTKEAMDVLLHYPWPGNIRELVNTVEMLIGMVEGPVIKKEDLPPYFFSVEKKEAPFVKKFKIKQYPSVRVRSREKERESGEADWRDVVYQREREAIKRALIEKKGNKAAVARKLGIPRSTLYEKLKKYGLS
jgi:transcriptional regulator with PAS, ATPase and Fis domain